MPRHKGDKSGPSGEHKNPRRQLTQEQGDWDAQDEKARAAGKTWARWARDLLKKHAK